MVTAHPACFTSDSKALQTYEQMLHPRLPIYPLPCYLTTLDPKLQTQPCLPCYLELAPVRFAISNSRLSATHLVLTAVYLIESYRT